MSRTPLIAIPSDTRPVDIYKGYTVPETYIEAILEGTNANPIIVPAVGANRINIDAILDRVDGVLISGSRTNVHPANYGVEPSERYEPYDQDRDQTSIPIIKRAIERGIPLLAICRGIQELNVALGGSLMTEIQEGEGRFDHRTPEIDDNDKRFAIRQTATVKEGSCLADVLGAGEININSLHRQAINKLGNGLQIEVLADDGIIEAVSVIDAKGFAVGVQWHPEYWVKSDNISTKIFKAFDESVQNYMQARA
jgi:putative glutamine amidotransferase